MKVMLYFEHQDKLKKSGIGRAYRHQSKALQMMGIDYTLDIKDSYDFVHINTIFSKSYKLLKKSHKKGLKVICHGHSTIEDFRYSFRCWRLIVPLYNHFIYRMYRHADCIITPTNYSKKLIEGYKGVNCPVYAVSNGVDLAEYAFDQEKIKSFEEYFKIKDEKVVIGVGFYFERKGFLDFMEIARQMPDVKFIWFGYLSKIMCQSKINRAIKHKPDNVILPKYIDGAIMKGAFQRADCLLFASLEETEGIVVLEGLASKLPVITRDIGVYEDWLTDGVNAFKAKDVVGFIEKINYVFNNDMTTIVENGYKTAEERSLDKVGLQIKEIYEKTTQK